MKKIEDKFSIQSKAYKKYRPKYPAALYTEILNLVENKTACWDCGTGNGQVALQLSKHFEKVYATDISQKQIDLAEKRDNIFYTVGRGEETAFEDNSFDLITVAQAIHWFDFTAFNQEVKRVAKNGAIISIWGYGLLRIEKEIDALMDEFYHNIMGQYWDPERRHVDNAYVWIDFDFEELKINHELSIQVNWSMEHLEGYLNSWSSIQNYKAENTGENPVYRFIDSIRKYWKADEVKTVIFPIFMRIGRIVKSSDE